MEDSVTEFQKLRKDVTELKATVRKLMAGLRPKPVFVNTRGCEQMFGIKVSTLLYLLGTGQLQGIAVKYRNRWFIHVERFTEFLLQKQENGYGQSGFWGNR